MALSQFSSQKSDFDWRNLGDRRPHRHLQPPQQRSVALNHIPAELQTWMVWNTETTQHGFFPSLKCCVLFQQFIFKAFIGKQLIQTLYVLFCWVLLSLLQPISCSVLLLFFLVFLVYFVWIYTLRMTVGDADGWCWADVFSKAWSEKHPLFVCLSSIIVIIYVFDNFLINVFIN